MPKTDRNQSFCKGAQLFLISLLCMCTCVCVCICIISEYKDTKQDWNLVYSKHYTLFLPLFTLILFSEFLPSSSNERSANFSTSFIAFNCLLTLSCLGWRFYSFSATMFWVFFDKCHRQQWAVFPHLFNIFVRNSEEFFVNSICLDCLFFLLKDHKLNFFSRFSLLFVL